MKKNYWNSSNRWIYIRIAVCHFTTPSHVYDVAHKSYNNYEDFGILKDLQKAGIIG